MWIDAFIDCIRAYWESYGYPVDVRFKYAFVHNDNDFGGEKTWPEGVTSGFYEEKPAGEPPRPPWKRIPSNPQPRKPRNPWDRRADQGQDCRRPDQWPACPLPRDIRDHIDLDEISVGKMVGINRQPCNPPLVAEADAQPPPSPPPKS